MFKKFDCEIDTQLIKKYETKYFHKRRQELTNSQELLSTRDLKSQREQTTKNIHNMEMIRFNKIIKSQYTDLNSSYYIGTSVRIFLYF